MALVSYYVRYSDPRDPTPTSSVTKHKQTGPDVYHVLVNVQSGMDSHQIWTEAYRLSKPLRNADLVRRQKQSPTLKPVAPSKPSVLKVCEIVFHPDEIMQFVKPLRQDVAAVAGCAVRFELNASEPTASTDCKSYVSFNPEPYLKGEIEAGDGRGLHEASHIAFSRDGGDLMAKAHKDGGESLAGILNLIMDRRDDDLNCRHNPGFALKVRRRMGHLFPGADGRNGVSFEARQSVFTDFAYACKKRTHPNFSIVKKCVNISARAIGRVNRKKRSYKHLLVVAKEVLKLLREHATEYDQQKAKEQEEQFQQFMKALQKLIHGSRPSQTTQTAFRNAMAQVLATQRAGTLQRLQNVLKNLKAGLPLVPGTQEGNDPRIIKVRPDPVKYGPARVRVRPYVGALKQVLRELSLPIDRQVRGLDDGDLDEDELHILAAGGSDCMTRHTEEASLDVAISFLVDVSGSMAGHTETIDLGVLFNEALLDFGKNVDAFFYGFHNNVFDCGRAQPNNGIASLQCDGGTDEHFGLAVAGQRLYSVARRRKIVVVACDGGPSNPKKVEEVCAKLMSHGVLPIRALVGVDTAPRTYPVELFFDNFPELLRELTKVFRGILLASRS